MLLFYLREDEAVGMESFSILSWWFWALLRRWNNFFYKDIIIKISLILGILDRLKNIQNTLLLWLKYHIPVYKEQNSAKYRKFIFTKMKVGKMRILIPSGAYGTWFFFFLTN